jgi:tRNA(Leu) C34 or U34 (ribose-2'-O)-methylase TrmL
MQSFVSIVTSENYQQFIDRDPSKYKVLLFTERKTTAPIFKALSKQYKDKLLFGEVRKSSEAALVSKFQVTTFPTLLVVTDPAEYQGEAF